MVVGSLQELLDGDRSQKLFFLTDGAGDMIYDGQRLSQIPGYESSYIEKRIVHATRWCQQRGREFSFLHTWPDPERLGTTITREVTITPFRGDRMSVNCGKVVPLEQSSFHSGISSEILQTVSESMLVVEPERPAPGAHHRVLYANSGFQNLYGYAPEEIVGRAPTLLQGEDSQQEELQKIHDALEGWRSVAVEVSNYTKDGERIDSYIRIVPIRDETGWWCYWVGFQHDAGKERKIAEELKRQQMILKALGIGLWTMNITNGELDWDDGMYELYGVSRETFSRSFEDWEKTLAPEDRPRAMDIYRETLDKADTDLDTQFTIIRGDTGEERLITGRSEHIDIDGVEDEIIYGINYDRTDEVELRRQVDDQRSLLERRERYAAMGELAAGIGHEIRNPLQIALGHLEAMEAELDIQSESAKQLRSALERIQGISDGLRNFGRAEAPEMVPVNLSDMLHESLDLVAPVFAQQGVSFDCGCDAEDEHFIIADRSRLQQVFLNLFANARDAMADSSTREVRIRVDGQDDTMLIIDVQDTGPGISSEVKDQLFKEAITTKELGKGSGLGLQLSKQIVEEHNGTITALDSRPGEGATFRILLPKTRARKDQALKGVTGEKQTSDDQALVKSVLLVDDEDGIRRLLAMQLEKVEVDVTDVDCVDAALDWLTQPDHRVDAIICDLNMPGKPGSALIRELNRHEIPLPRFILLTGSSGAEIQDLLGDEEEQVYKILSKPFRFKELLPYLGRSEAA